MSQNVTLFELVEGLQGPKDKKDAQNTVQSTAFKARKIGILGRMCSGELLSKHRQPRKLGR
jgi:hypothetical protein